MPPRKQRIPDTKEAHDKVEEAVAAPPDCLLIRVHFHGDQPSTQVFIFEGAGNQLAQTTIRNGIIPVWTTLSQWHGQFYRHEARHKAALVPVHNVRMVEILKVHKYQPKEGDTDG